ADDGFENSAFSTEATNYTIGTPATEEKSPGPAGYWAFDEGTDNTCSGGTNDTCDTTSNTNDGAFVGAPTWRSEDMCISGKCLFFDGSDDEVSITNASAIDVDTGLNTGVTYETWVKVLSDGENDEGRIFQNGGNTLIQIQNEGSDGYADILFQQDLGTAATVTITDGIQLNKWHHLAMAYTDDGDDEITVYIDGVNRGASTNGNSSPTSSTSNLVIGGMNIATGRNFHGFIDEFKIYNYERSEDEIKADLVKAASSEGASALFGKESNAFLNDGLGGYWKMDDSSVDAEGEISTDSSGNGNSGTLYGDNSTGDNGTGMDCTVSGKFGTGCDFDGTDDEVDVSDSTSLHLQYGGEITLAAWIKTSDSSGNIIDKSAGNGTNRYGLGLNSGLLRAAFVATDYSGDNNITAYGSTSVNDGNWHHVAITYEYATQAVKFYVDGNYEIEDTVAPSESLGTSIDALTIGESLQGQVDEARIYNRALSSSEVQNLYAWAPEPAAYYSFDENTGTSTINDKSGNSYNGSFTSMNESLWTTGKYGAGLSFDGSMRIVGTDPIVNNYPFSVTGWVKYTASGATTVLFGIGNSASTTGYYEIQGTGAGGIRALSNNGSDNYTGSNTAYNDGQWHHVAMIWASATDRKFYIDGTLDGTSTSSVAFQSSVNRWKIGERASNSTCCRWNGYADEIKVYNYALTPGQIIRDMNAGHPLGGSPVGSQIAYWSFDEMYGDTANDSVGDIEGDLGNTDTTCPATGADCPVWTPNGKINGALDFNGTDDNVYVNTPNNSGPLFLEEKLTISAWIKADDSEIAGTQLAVAKQASSYQIHYALGIVNNTAYFRIGDASTSVTLNGTTDISSGGSTWYHLAGTWDIDIDGGAVNLYVNGKVEDTDYRTTEISTWQDLYIGGADDGTVSNFNGLIDEVKIYGTSLTAEQILIDMNSNAAADFGAKTNEAASLEDGAGNDPVGRWNFNENTGTSANDTTGSGNLGTLSGATWTTGAPGKSTALVFDGSDDYVEIGTDSKVDNSAQGSITAWVYPHDMTATNRAIFGFGGAATGFAGRLEFYTYNGGLFISQNTNGATQNWIRTNYSQLTTNNWHHVAVTSDGAAWKLYINGVEQTTLLGAGSNNGNWFSDTTATAPVHTTIGRIFHNGTWKEPYYGKIDEVTLYDYELSPAQVAYNYNRGAPIGWWQFDECQGAVAYDASGNSNNGSITIGATGDNTSTGTCSSGTSTEAWNNGTTGKFNGSLDFDGTDDAVSSTTLSGDLDDLSELSVCMWVYNIGSDTDYGYFDNLNGGGGGFVLMRDESGSTSGRTDTYKVYISEASGGDTVHLEGNNSIAQINTWTHICGVYRENNVSGLRLYVNGKEDTFSPVSTVGVTNIDSSGTTAYIGRRQGGDYHSGQIDDVRIYNYALSQTQIQNIINNAAAARFGPNTGSP
ncbi:MAG: LamG domain-containing protein, partial [Patescibacteria group bacterium]